MKTDRRTFLLGTGAVLASGGAAALSAAPAAPDRRRSFTDWYHTYAMSTPEGTTPDTAVGGVTGFSMDILGIFNLTGETATATITHYFENLPPRRTTTPLKPRASVAFLPHTLPETELPRKTPYAVRVQTPVPVIVQATRIESESNPAKPRALRGNSFLSRLAYQGPLGKAETAWAYADGYVERRKPGTSGFEDKEWISILNPNPQAEAKISLSFNYADQPSSHQLTLPPERMCVLDLWALPALRDDGMYGVIVESTVPVVVEQIRRSSHTDNRNPNGMWILPGAAVGDVDFKLPTA